VIGSMNEPMRLTQRKIKPNQTERERVSAMLSNSFCDLLTIDSCITNIMKRNEKNVTFELTFDDEIDQHQ